MTAIKRYLLGLSTALFLLSSVPAIAESKIHPIRGFMPDLAFTLQGANNQIMTEKDLKGKVVLMFFGYANCPDICPTSMAQLADVMEKLGDDAAKVRILFVSVDPYRDNPNMLQEYVENFDDRYAIGLTGSSEQIADLARRYRVAYQIAKPDASTPKYYEVSHSRGVYFFDAKGKARYLASDSEAVESLVEKVRAIL